MSIRRPLHLDRKVGSVEEQFNQLIDTYKEWLALESGPVDRYGAKSTDDIKAAIDAYDSALVEMERTNTDVLVKVLVPAKEMPRGMAEIERLEREQPEVQEMAAAARQRDDEGGVSNIWPWLEPGYEDDPAEFLRARRRGRFMPWFGGGIRKRRRKSRRRKSKRRKSHKRKSYKRRKTKKGKRS